MLCINMFWWHQFQKWFIGKFLVIYPSLSSTIYIDRKSPKKFSMQFSWSLEYWLYCEKCLSDYVGLMKMKNLILCPPQNVRPSTNPEGHRHYFVVFTGREQLWGEQNCLLFSGDKKILQALLIIIFLEIIICQTTLSIFEV